MTEILSKTCEYCGKVFYKTSKTQNKAAFLARKYCSQSCANKARVTKFKNQQTQTKVCEYCGKAFTKKSHETNKTFEQRRFCSVRCERRTRPKDVSWIKPKACIHCGKPFMPHSYDSKNSFGKRQFCSADCQYEHLKVATAMKRAKLVKECVVCGKTFGIRSNESQAHFFERHNCSAECARVLSRANTNKKPTGKEKKRIKIYPFNICVNILEANL